jgi:micrococcal nuclease
LLASLTLSACQSPQTTTSTSPPSLKTAERKPPEQQPVSTSSAAQSAQQLTPIESSPNPEQQQSAQPPSTQQGGELYQVVKVVDGDTIDVAIDGYTERLRLIGMDTPETVDPRKPVQCFGKEASSKARELLEGKRVRLEADDSQGERDKYQRLLRYVYLEDDTFFNQYMIAEGYAHEYTYQSNPYRHQEEFKIAERQARENKKGLWGNVCNGNTSQAASAGTASSQKTITPDVTSTSAYTCDCGKTCAQMDCEEAQYQLNACGCSRRDADKDGVACDTQCQ